MRGGPDHHSGAAWLVNGGRSSIRHLGLVHQLRGVSWAHLVLAVRPFECCPPRGAASRSEHSVNAQAGTQPFGSSFGRLNTQTG